MPHCEMYALLCKCDTAFQLTNVSWQRPANACRCMIASTAIYYEPSFCAGYAERQKRLPGTKKYELLPHIWNQSAEILNPIYFKHLCSACKRSHLLKKMISIRGGQRGMLGVVLQFFFLASMSFENLLFSIEIQQVVSDCHLFVIEMWTDFVSMQVDTVN